ncbi:MAG: ClpX C4-type zinc finger protein [Solirubrobacteraceae bacterium]
MSTDGELRERLTVANERLADALLMFESEDARLSHLADVINELAGALRAMDSLGAKLDPSIRLPASEPLPHELDRDGPRTPVLAWQGFDRALEALLARRDAPPIDLAVLADGYDHLAQAARNVVAALRSSADSYASELIRCTLCNKRRSEVPDMVIGPGKFICSECVELCVEILEERRGVD